MRRILLDVAALAVILSAAATQALSASINPLRTDEGACSYICTSSCPGVQEQETACKNLLFGCHLDQTCRAGHTNCTSSQMETTCYLGS